MQPTYRFTVISELPERLAGLGDLAANLRWAWDHRVAEIFDRIDDRRPGSRWRDIGQHPYDLLRSMPPDRLRQLAEDDDLVVHLEHVTAHLADVLGGASWYGQRQEPTLGVAGPGDEAGDPSGGTVGGVAYFSPEFGITEMVPQYSGGLGVLAGDHLKASSDLGIPLVGVGLWYSEGYFHQFLDGSGWQGERNDRIDPSSLGLVDTGVVVSVELDGVAARIKVWRLDVGRIPLYLLDTNLADNPTDVRGITNRLYGGDQQHRLRQEIVLGIGGVRALRALGIQPDVFHMNEGHAGFLGLERVREWVERGLTFPEAIQAVSAGTVFTTHTPVPAGIDRFPYDLFARYFAGFAQALGLTVDELFALGRRDDEGGDMFNMAVMGMRLAARRNGVAALHGAVARNMFQALWPPHDDDEIPVGHVTNGVHARSWVSRPVDDLIAGAVGDDWHLADADRLAAVRHLDHAAIWNVRSDGRRELVDLVRDRLGDDVLDPDVLTIGFARRFATYKRANLLLSDPDRLRRLLLDAERPVQFVFAGKAHPADHPGKSLIQQIHQLTRNSALRHRFVFIPDYDIGIARTMYHGCDVWLNTPRRPMEACGTSGMKAALNGVLNCSIRDGWWDEMSNGENGWDIPSYDGLDGVDEIERDRREAAATFDLLERSLVPLYYDRGDSGLPHGWIGRIVENWASLNWRVTAARMVRDYVEQYYEPAATHARRITADDAAAARELAAWRTRTAAAWETVGLELHPVQASDVAGGHAGTERHVRAIVHRGRLEWSDLSVELVHGPLRPDGTIDAAKGTSQALLEPATSPSGRTVELQASFTPATPGPWGVTARILPTHPLLANRFEPGLVARPV